MKFTIGRKILIANLLSTVTILISIFFLISYSFQDAIINQLMTKMINYSEDAQIYVMNMVKNCEYKNLNKELSKLSPFVSNYLSKKYGVKVEIFNDRKKLLAGSLPYKKYYSYQDIHYAANGIKNYVIKKEGNEEVLFLSSPIYYGSETVGVIRFIYILSDESSLINRIKFMLLLIGGLSLILIALANVLFTNGIVRPIKKLQAGVEKMQNGIFDTKIEIKSSDEIEELSKAFNGMSQSLDHYIKSLNAEREKQKIFFDNVTHELKTPISVILGHGELLKRIKNPSDREKSLNYIIFESQRLMKMVEDLLYVSKLNKPTFEISKTDHDISSIAKSCIELLSPRFEKFQINITENVQPKMLNIDADRIKEVILNILDNAIKHSKCTKIEILGRVKDKKYFLYIKDNGIGLNKAVTDDFFYDRTTLNKRNFKLGLKISRMIMEKHGGNLKVQSENGNGTTVIMELDL